jgi:hypothetical protein
MSYIKPFYINDNSILINLTTTYCKTKVELLESHGFKILLAKFFDSITEDSNRRLYCIKSKVNTVDEVIDLFRLLLIYSFEEAINFHKDFSKFKECQEELIFFVNALYDYWREYERYGIIERNFSDLGQDNQILIDSTTKFWKNNLSLYRTLLSKLQGRPIYVYRQTPGGFNAGFIVSKHNIDLPIEYSKLNDINVINACVIRTPFIGHSKSNSRSGLFKEVNVNPIRDLKLTKRHWLCFPVKIGDLVAYVYFHRNILHHGIALSNLFEPAFQEYKDGIKPDIIYVYGSSETEYDKSFFIDRENDIYVGYVSRLADNDYFGYMKKMLLTLHNVYMINHGILPIHGAMVNIVSKANKESNIVIIGDSGAGKSETLEALRFIADKEIKEMNIIFDDMGIFFNDNNQIKSKGTETGAFIRLDDLETGYAYKELDRAIFMNPEQHNARVVLPVSSYDFIVKDHQIDYVFYANNYEDKELPVRLFNTVEEAVLVFKEGKRKAKGTTSEKGIVSSYFANPFGCVQFKEDTEKLIDSMFSTLFNNKIPVGEIYTKLAIPGKENTGVKNAAKEVLKLIK